MDAQAAFHQIVNPFIINTVEPLIDQMSGEDAEEFLRNIRADLTSEIDRLIEEVVGA